MENSRFINGSSIPKLWLSVFSTLLKLKEVSPMIISLNNFDPEITNIDFEEVLNSYLNKLGEQEIRNVAFTIFPNEFWNPNKTDDFLYEKYKRNWSKIYSYRLNKNGTYFQRLITYNNVINHKQKWLEKYGKQEPINQLEHIIDTWNYYKDKKNPRRSALQATIFDPRVDHSKSLRKGFPCLQQLIFHPIGVRGQDGLELIAIYVTQTIFEKAYGNYLGLYNLGRFMAKEMDLQLVKVTCYTSVAKLSNNSVNISLLKEVQNKLSNIL